MAFEYGPDGYNYADFVLPREVPLFESFRDRLHVGQKGPDHELTRLDDGATVKLSDDWAEARDDRVQGRLDEQPRSGVGPRGAPRGDHHPDEGALLQ